MNPTRPEPSVIQVRVGEVRQLFNSIDPSPFKERDLDPDCEEFIVSWARELPTDQPLGIEIRIERDQPPQSMLDAIAPAVQHHFESEAALQRLKLRRTVRDARLSLTIGLLTLGACMAGATLVPVATLGTFGEILRESLIIAGWVVMWHPLEILLYGLWPAVRERRLLERLAAAEVILVTPARERPT
jgi:hypothetical protein